MKRPLLVAFVVAGVCLVAASAYFFSALNQPLKVSSSDYLLVQRGASLNSVVTSLETQLPVSTFVFRVYARLTNAQGLIKAGEYDVSSGVTSIQLLDKLRSGDVVQRQVTFPEGWTINQWIEQIAKVPYLANNSRAEVEASLGDLASWEGTVYPDTYAYTRGEKAFDVMGRARQKMNQVLDEVWQSRTALAEVMSKQDVLILASLIEKETGYEPDRGLIASVFNNRLSLGMRLQSDPTVIYGIPDFDGDLRRSHLRLKHPYNTYVVEGLPAGPICNPGLASLEAAVNPPSSPYLYFVAQGDGRSYFSTSLEEHNRAVKQYQKAGRVKDYRSAPPSTSN
jgi:UPF0755 protein